MEAPAGEPSRVMSWDFLVPGAGAGAAAAAGAGAGFRTGFFRATGWGLKGLRGAADLVDFEGLLAAGDLGLAGLGWGRFIGDSCADAARG